MKRPNASSYSSDQPDATPTIATHGAHRQRPTHDRRGYHPDLNDEDETGFAWTFLDEARNPSLVVPGAIIIAGTPDAPAVTEVVDLVDKPAGIVVHLRILPGTIADYAEALQRASTPV